MSPANRIAGSIFAKFRVMEDCAFSTLMVAVMYDLEGARGVRLNPRSKDVP